jgi:hypothetical protein
MSSVVQYRWSYTITKPETLVNKEKGWERRHGIRPAGSRVSR